MNGAFKRTSRSHVAFALIVLSTACRPDLSTPEKAASAFVEAVNSGDLKRFEGIVGSDAIAKAVQDCEKWRAKPLPASSGLLGNMLREYAQSRKDQDCAKIAPDLKDFLSYMSKTSGMKVRSVEAPSNTDGVERAEVVLEPPNWSGKREQLDRVILVRAGDGKWVPATGDFDATPIANYVFALHGAARGHVETTLSEMGIR